MRVFIGEKPTNPMIITDKGNSFKKILQSSRDPEKSMGRVVNKTLSYEKAAGFGIVIVAMCCCWSDIVVVR